MKFGQRSRTRSLIVVVAVLAFNLVLVVGIYETIGWLDVRGYRDVTYGLVAGCSRPMPTRTPDCAASRAN
jgi:hypothetical protein